MLRLVLLLLVLVLLLLLPLLVPALALLLVLVLRMLQRVLWMLLLVLQQLRRWDTPPCHQRVRLLPQSTHPPLHLMYVPQPSHLQQAARPPRLLPAALPALVMRARAASQLQQTLVTASQMRWMLVVMTVMVMMMDRARQGPALARAGAPAAQPRARA